MANPLGTLSTSSLSELLPSSSSVFPCEIHQLSSTSGSRRNPGFLWNSSLEPPPRGFDEKEDHCLFAPLLHILHHFYLSLRLQFSSSQFPKLLQSLSAQKGDGRARTVWLTSGSHCMLTARCLSRSGFVEHLYDPYTHTYTQDLTLVSSLSYPSGIRQADREQAYTVQRDHQVPKAGWSHILLDIPCINAVTVSSVRVQCLKEEWGIL